MESTFYSQNTGRYYPFDEAAVQSQSSTRSCEELEILRKAVVDLGMVILLPRIIRGTVKAFVDIYTTDAGRAMRIEIRISDLVFSSGDILLPTSDFDTVKFRTLAGNSEIYGFVTSGYMSLLTDFQQSVLQVPVHRTCIKPMLRELQSVTAANEDRWLPPAECWEERPARPEEWDYGELMQPGEVSMRLKAGYNCKLTVSEADGRVIIQPEPGAGMGELLEHIPLGRGLDGILEEPISDLYFPRLDNIQEDLVVAKSFAGAYGLNVKVVTDENFVSFVSRSESDERGCVEQCLVIRYEGAPPLCSTTTVNPGTGLQPCE